MILNDLGHHWLIEQRGYSMCYYIFDFLCIYHLTPVCLIASMDKFEVPVLLCQLNVSISVMIAQTPKAK